jgi:hypothetical protein
VAELAGSPRRAAIDPPAQHDPAPYPGTDRDHHQVVGDEPQLCVVGLGERGDGGVVVHEHGHAQAVAQDLPQRHVGQRDVDRRDDASRLELDH